MLVLRRKVGETVVVAGTVIVQVLAIEGARIKVGIIAPLDTPIVRGELLTASAAHTAASIAPPEPTEPSASSAPSLEPQNAAPRRSRRPRRSPRLRRQERRP